jgi:hypothetical protein
VICSLGVGSIVYSTGTSLIRYLYVRSSLVTNIQETLKRDSFVIKSIIIGESINCFNLGSFYFHHHTMVLYKACLNPWQNFNIPLHQVMPLNQLIILFCIVLNVSCNIFLSFFLSKKTAKNLAIKEVDKKKDRKRNLIPANIGLYVFVFYGLSMVLFLITYNYKSENLDSGTRAFLNAAYADIHHCVSSPIFIFFGSADARKLLSQLISNGMVKIKQMFTT